MALILEQDGDLVLPLLRVFIMMAKKVVLLMKRPGPDGCAQLGECCAGWACGAAAWGAASFTAMLDSNGHPPSPIAAGAAAGCTWILR